MKLNPNNEPCNCPLANICCYWLNAGSCTEDCKCTHYIDPDTQELIPHSNEELPF